MQPEILSKLPNKKIIIGVLVILVLAVALFFLIPRIKNNVTTSVAKIYEPTVKEKISTDYSRDTGVTVGDIKKDGVVVLLPAGALGTDTKLNIVSSGENLLPIPAEDGFALGHPIQITVGDGKDTQLNKPAVVSMKIDISQLSKETTSDDIYVTYFNEDTQKWEFFTPESVDLVTGQITFLTNHFSDFMAVSTIKEETEMMESELKKVMVMSTIISEKSEKNSVVATPPPSKIINPTEFYEYKVFPDLRRVRDIVREVYPEENIGFVKDDFLYIKKLAQLYLKPTYKNEKDREDKYNRLFSTFINEKLLKNGNHDPVFIQKVIKKMRGIPVDMTAIEKDTGNIYETVNFNIYYNKVDINNDSQIKDERWAEVNPPNEKSKKLMFAGTPLYVIDLANYFEFARQKYIDAGFKYPGWDSENKTQSSKKINVYIHFPKDEGIISSGSYRSVTGYIVIGAGSVITSASLKQRVAHELFHSVQNEYFNTLQMKLTGRTWWLESSADYAAYKVIWNGGEGVEGPAAIARDYPQFSITQSDGEHDYSTGWFIDYMVNNGANFKEMWDYAAKAEWLNFADVLNPLNEYLKNNKKQELALMYQGFIKELVFGKDSKIAELNEPPVDFGSRKNVETVSGWIKITSEIKEEKVVPAMATSNYSSTVIGITATPFPGESKRNLEVSLKELPEKDVEIYVYRLNGNRRSGANHLGTFSSSDPKINTITANLGENDGLYFLAVNSSSYSSVFNIVIKDKKEEPVIASGFPRVAVKFNLPLEQYGSGGKGSCLWTNVPQIERQNLVTPQCSASGSINSSISISCNDGKGVKMTAVIDGSRAEYRQGIPEYGGPYYSWSASNLKTGEYVKNLVVTEPDSANTCVWNLGKDFSGASIGANNQSYLNVMLYTTADKNAPAPEKEIVEDKGQLLICYDTGKPVTRRVFKGDSCLETPPKIDSQFCEKEENRNNINCQKI